MQGGDDVADRAAVNRGARDIDGYADRNPDQGEQYGVGDRKPLGERQQ